MTVAGLKACKPRLGRPMNGEIEMSNQATGNSAHQPREGFMAPTFRIFVRTAEGDEFQAFAWCRDEASGIARAWREGREFGHNVAAVWAEAV